MPPYISSRAYIQWLPDPPSEPTSTLVLTSSQRGFVDIRVIADDTPGSKPINPSHVEWSFAGHSTSCVVDGKTHTQWHHWIDSKTQTPEDVVDKGEMLPEDSEGLALEKGSMVNPITGRMTEYVEAWRDVDVGVVPSIGEEVIKEFSEKLRERGVVVDGGKSRAGGENSGLMGGEGSAASRLSLVMQHEDVSRSSRGMVVRLGHLCQGVARMGDEFALDRWEWTAEAGWRKTRSSGNLDMPCDVLNMLGDLVDTDSTVRYGDDEAMVWRCIEAEKF